MALYFASTLVALAVAQVPMAAAFYSWQLLRVFLIYAAVARGCAADPRVAPSLLNGMAIGVLFEAAASIWQRFAMGMIQAGGTVGHQNFLGLLSHLIVFPFFALLLAGQRGWLPKAVVLAGLAIEILTTSRATIGLAGFGFSLLFVISALRQWTSRKAQILMVAVAVAVVATPVAILSFEHRFASEGAASDYDERAAFERAAAMILADHPLGVGANNYVVAANGGGYNNAAGVAIVAGSDSAHVHNVYYLIGAETGYLGLVTFVLLILRPAIVAFLCGWRNRNDVRGDLLLGLAVGLLIVYIHSLFEWVFIVYISQYLFAMDIGMIAAIASQLGYWQTSLRSVRYKAELLRTK
jgi:O-antigen ligase